MNQPIISQSSSDTLREMEETKKKLDASYTRKGLAILTISFTAIAIFTAVSIISPLTGLLIAIADLVGIVAFTFFLALCRIKRGELPGTALETP